MVPVHVLTLIMASAPGPSIIVLQPLADKGSTANSRVVPIWVGVSEATQLGIALERVRFARPMTHDLYLDTITTLDAVVDHVLIDKVQGPTFFAKLCLRNHGRLIELDARPSDAIALALREEAPIYLTEEVLEKASFPYVFSDKANEEKEVAAFHDFIDTLSPDDFSPSGSSPSPSGGTPPKNETGS